MRKITFDNFLELARKIHGDKYDYSKAKYVNTSTRICIICPIHGEFWQTPSKHLRGRGCPSCGGTKKKTKEDFVKRAIEIHGNKYDYSKVVYVNNKTKVCIICPTHGEFWQTPDNHLSKKQGCPQCKSNVLSEIQRLTITEFIFKSQQVHGNIYDYSKVKYINSHTKICIICPTHGEFWQTPSDHLRGHGCQICKKEKLAIYHSDNLETFIKKAIKVYGDKYDYSKVEYIDSQTKVCIICPIHGEFWVRPNSHLRGCGCPFCHESKLERQVNLTFPHLVRQKKFEWLGQQSLDFFDEKNNIAIECQGKQHFFPVKHFGGEEGFNIIIERDIRKKKLLDENNVKIYYIVDNDVKIENLPTNIYNTENTLHINDINNLKELLI